jgi:hypothetical protein
LATCIRRLSTPKIRHYNKFSFASNILSASALSQRRVCGDEGGGAVLRLLRSPKVYGLLVSYAAAAAIIVGLRSGSVVHAGDNSISLLPISIDYPESGSIFPPGITPPTFLWRDAAGTSWAIDINFGDGARPDPPGD